MKTRGSRSAVVSISQHRLLASISDMNSRVFVSRCIRQLSMATFSPKPMHYHVRMIGAIPISRDIKDLYTSKQVTHNLQTCRYKSKKKSKKVQQDEESDDEAEEAQEEEEEGSDVLPGEKEKILKLSQLRTDKVMRLAMNSSRIVDEAFLEGRLRKNDSKVLKKSVPIQEGDILDVEVGPDSKNPEFLKVHRVEILEIKEGGSHSAVRVMISKNLTIKSYDS